MIDPDLLTIVFDVYKPWNNSTPDSTNNPGRIVPDLQCGRGSGLAGLLTWTHYLDCQPDVDVTDATTRPAGSDSELYADGDGIHIDGPPDQVWVVVFKVWMNQGTGDDFFRLFLIRDAIA